MSTPDHDTFDVDVAIVGDGPAAGALCRACCDQSLDVVVFGRGQPWTNTYAAWLDDLSGHVSATDIDRLIPTPHAPVRVIGERHHAVDRAYGVFDNAQLRDWSRIDQHLRTAEVRSITQHEGGATVRFSDAGDERSLRARWVVDATGASPTAHPSAWQTAYGVFIDADRTDDLRATLDVATPGPVATLMDWSPLPTAPDVGAPTFGYVVKVGDRWLVEETVLASRTRVDPDALRPRLVARIGEAFVVEAEERAAVERVTIPMGLPARSGTGRIAVFGAAAGMGHPATGYSVAASIRSASALADAIACDGDVHRVVWNTTSRSVRALHDYGLAVMLGFDGSETREFFDAFFDLPIDVWAPYMRNDSSVIEVGRAMSHLFGRLPWAMRRRLVAAGPSFAAERVRRRRHAAARNHDGADFGQTGGRKQR